MGRIHEGVKTVNSVFRTLIAGFACCVIGWGGYLGWSEYHRHAQEIAVAHAQVAQLQTELKTKEERLDHVETSLRLVKTDKRLARLEVIGVDRDENNRAIQSRLQFVELSPTGEPISLPKQFTLPGNIIYIDCWLVKFDDKFTEEADIERGTSLCLFRQIFSDQQRPGEGFQLDEVGMRPQAYAHGGALSDFEKKLWSEFWEFANDEEKAEEMGIRAANGDAVSIQVREGKSYNIVLRSSDGLSLQSTDSKQTTP